MKKYFNIHSRDLHAKILLILIVILALLFRSFDVNWDNGFHLHPDERAITLYTVPLAIPASWYQFFSVNSPLNPHFFAYGSFPIYLLYTVSQIAKNFNPLLGAYDQINILGRYISLVFEIGTLFTLFLIAKKLFSKRTALITTFFYAIAVFPIQNAHFYTVDAMLTCFVMITLYQLICFYFQPSKKHALVIGIFFGLALATKDSALALLSSIWITLALDFLLIFLRKPHKPKHYLPHLPIFLKRILINGLIILITSAVVFIIFEPYMLLDSQEFWQQTEAQNAMTQNAFVFPYTLQYVNKIPYFYELKNIFLWGLGPEIAVASFLGILFITYLALKNYTDEKHLALKIILVFFFAYFYVVGKFHVGFMRYMLPEYPIFCLAAAVFVMRIGTFIQKKSLLLYRILFALFFLSCLIYPLSFMHIYTQPNTRVQATNWILKNIPAGSTIAIEHWDDALPLLNSQQYKTITLTLYDPDTAQKWTTIKSQLQQTQYIIIASNRLYVPLQKLTNCNQLPANYCYPLTAEYYKELFNGKLGFKKVAEFAVYPTIPVLNIPINDQGADESFTVYDHPKVMIFKKI